MSFAARSRVLARPVLLAQTGELASRLRKQWGLVNRPIPSSKKFHFQNQAKCKQELYKTFLEKMSVICLRKKKFFMSMASYLTLLWSTGLRQLVAYPPPTPTPCSGRGRRGFYWLVHSEKVVLIVLTWWWIWRGFPKENRTWPKTNRRFPTRLISQF